VRFADVSATQSFRSPRRLESVAEIFLKSGEDIMSILVEQTIEERLANIESRLDQLLDGKQQRESYSVEQFAERVGLDPWTIREYCRHGRILASKKGSGRGRYRAWAISHVELRRYENEGLLPIRKPNG
jgi:hypothetical protein